MDARDLVDSIACVVFDVGETLVDETRSWTERARSAGITPFAFMAVVGAMIERDEDHRAAWALLGVSNVPPAPTIRSDDLYPDALECVAAVREAGRIVGIAGNQPAGVASELAAVGLAPDFVASSAEWGVSKPSGEFFDRVIASCGRPPESILYVGDRLDNDVTPARAAGMRTALIRRGPWGILHAGRADADLADMRLDSLSELATALRP